MSWVCGHLLGLCSFPGSWAVVMSWMGLWSCPGSVIISWLVVCGHILGGSVVIFWRRNHFLGRRLWSCPGSVVIFWVCGHFLDGGLWSCPGSVVITLVCGNFLARGLWSYPGWICHHFLNLWSFSGSWAVIMSFIGLWSSPGSVVIGHQGTMPASRQWGAYENQKITKEIVGIQPQFCEFLIGMIGIREHPRLGIRKSLIFGEKSKGGAFVNANFRHFSNKEIS